MPFLIYLGVLVMLGGVVLAVPVMFESDTLPRQQHKAPAPVVAAVTVPQAAQKPQAVPPSTPAQAAAAVPAPAPAASSTPETVAPAPASPPSPVPARSKMATAKPVPAPAPDAVAANDSDPMRAQASVAAAPAVDLAAPSPAPAAKIGHKRASRHHPTRLARSRWAPYPQDREVQDQSGRHMRYMGAPDGIPTYFVERGDGQ